MARKLEATIKIKADTKQADKAFTSLQTDAKKALAAISAASAEINVDDDEARSKLKVLEKQLDALDAATTTLGIEANSEGARAELQQLDRQLDEIDARKVVAQVEIDAEDAQESLEGLSVASDDANDGFTLLSSKGAALVATFLAVAAATEGVRAAIVAEEAAVAQLDRALSSLGTGADAVSERLQQDADALSRLTGISRDQVIQSQALIASFVKEEEAITRLTAVSLDLATGRQIDTASAALVLGKSVGTATNALVEYAIEVDGAVGSTERMESAIEGVSEVYGGAAQAAGEAGLSGAMSQLGTAIKSLTVDVGEVSGGTEALAGVTNEATRQVKALGSETKNSGSAFSALLGSIFGVGKATQDVIDGFNAERREAQRLGVTVAELAAEQKRLAEATAEVAETELAAARVANAYEAENQRLLESFRELGVVIIDEVAELEKQEAAIRDADEALRRNIITRAEFVAITQAARGETLDTSEAIEDATSITDFYTAAILAARDGLGLFTAAEIASADAVVESAARRVAARASEGGLAPNALGGESGFVTISGGQFSQADATEIGINGRVSIFGRGGSGAGTGIG